MKTGPAPSSGRPIGCAPTSWCSTSTEGRRTSSASSSEVPLPRPPSCSGHGKRTSWKSSSPAAPRCAVFYLPILRERVAPPSSAERLLSARILERLRGELTSQQHVHE